MGRKFVIGLMGCLWAMALLPGCGSKPENAIVGKWQVTGQGLGMGAGFGTGFGAGVGFQARSSGETLQFSPDGTVSAGDGGAAKARYSFPDSQHLRLYGDSPSDAIVLGFRIDGDKMFLTQDCGGVEATSELDRMSE